MNAHSRAKPAPGAVVAAEFAMGPTGLWSVVIHRGAPPCKFYDGGDDIVAHGFLTLAAAMAWAGGQEVKALVPKKRIALV